MPPNLDKTERLKKLAELRDSLSTKSEASENESDSQENEEINEETEEIESDSLDNLDDEENNESEEVEEESEELGVQGKKALESERQLRKKAEKDLDVWLTKIKDVLGLNEEVSNKDLQENLNSSEEKYRRSELEKKVLRYPGEADPDRLLNHVGFLNELYELDSDDDVSSLIKKYSSKYDYLLKVKPKRSYSVNSSAGQSSATKELTREEKLAVARKNLRR